MAVDRYRPRRVHRRLAAVQLPREPDDDTAVVMHGDTPSGTRVDDPGGRDTANLDYACYLNGCTDDDHHCAAHYNCSCVDDDPGPNHDAGSDDDSRPLDNRTVAHDYLATRGCLLGGLRDGGGSLWRAVRLWVVR